MSKTTFYADLDNGETITRTTARNYPFVVVAAYGPAGRRIMRQAHLEHDQALLNKYTAPGYRDECFRDFLKLGEDVARATADVSLPGWIESLQDKVDDLTAKLAEDDDLVEWDVIGWSSRYDLADKLVAKALNGHRKGYRKYDQVQMLDTYTK
jgi:hypothetical protein